EYDEEGENENEDEDEDEDEDNDDDDDDDEDGDTDHQGSDEDNSDGEDDDGEDHDSLNALADMLRNRQGNNHSLFGFDIGGIARMSGASQFRPLVATLKKYDDQTQQLVALQELTELLSISTEESLIGLNIGELCQVLVNLLKGAGGDYGELTGFIPGNPDIMLLACRCLSNLLEALPLAGAVLVRFGTIEVLCGKLLEIEFIDLAEQALSTLEHLSREFPTKVCDAGGMSACLMFLDFFATSTQRTALACAANCARGVTNEHFSQAKDTVQILERTVGYSDQKIVESSCSALLHLINAFRSESEKVEQLVSADLVKSIVQCIHPDNPAASSTPVT
ncbi:Ubiquitin fusion degradation protein 4, partial [Dipsacomyces acuminosporus]